MPGEKRLGEGPEQVVLETVRALRQSSGSLLLSSEQREITKLQIMGVNKISFGFQYDLSGHTVEKGLEERNSMLQSDQLGSCLWKYLGEGALVPMGKTSQIQEMKPILGSSDKGKAAEEVVGWARWTCGQMGNTENRIGLGGRP